MHKIKNKIGMNVLETAKREELGQSDIKCVVHLSCCITEL